MNKPIHGSRCCLPLTIALIFLSGMAAAQTADQSFHNIPQQTKQAVETKAVTKSNTVANGAMNKLDSASNKAFKGFTGLFKKKNHPKDKNLKSDSSGTHRVDSTVVPPRSSSQVVVRPSFYSRMPA